MACACFNADYLMLAVVILASVIRQARLIPLGTCGKMHPGRVNEKYHELVLDKFDCQIRELFL